MLEPSASSPTTAKSQRHFMIGRCLYFSVSLLVLVLDRFTKALVEKHLFLHESRVIISGFLELTHTRNTGVAFGFFANSESAWTPYLLTFTSGVALIAILGFSLRHPVQNWELQLGLMLVLGGAAGNLYDRILYGYVTDFIDAFYGSYHWPTFNVADSSITVGICLLLLVILVQKSPVDRAAAL
jgi:signal peptidase II